MNYRSFSNRRGGFLLAKVMLVVLLLLTTTRTAQAEVKIESAEALADQFTVEKLVVSLKTVFNIVFYLLPGTVALFYLLLAAFKYITAQGIPAKLEEAKKTSTWAIVGLIVIVLAYSIVHLWNVTFLNGQIKFD